MATRMDRSVLRRLNTLFNVGTIRELTDGQLLERFATGRGEAAELAFAALVERHAPMVMRVCRARLTDPHEAQDAFQATFLVLVKKARSLWVKDSLGPWLHQVAHRTASCARADAARRRRLERQAAASAIPPEIQTDPGWESSLHDEINRLPERYRVPIVLCDLEGHTCEEAARRMGRPVGTVRCWRSRGRDRLRQRLTRLGLTPSVGIAALLSADFAEASSIKALTETTVRASVGILSGRAMSEGVSASVGSLIGGVLKAMLLSKLRASATAIILLSLMASGLVAVARVMPQHEDVAREEGTSLPAQARPRVVPEVSKPADNAVWKLSLQEAIRIGLDNHPSIGQVRLIGPGSSTQIAPSMANVDPLQFKVEMMALVRTIEMQYWDLGRMQAQIKVAEMGSKLSEEVLNRLRSELKAGRGTTAGIVETEQSHERFQLDLATRTSALIGADRRFRRTLGLPPADGRQIVPITTPIDTKVEFDWEDCLTAMRESQPDLVKAKADVKAADGKDLATLEQLRTMLQTVTYQLTHSLARFFTEADTNFKQRQIASDYRSKSQKRLELNKVLYDDSKITTDFYLRSIRQYIDAAANEAQFTANYNISIVSLQEAKGTLLEDVHIALAEGSRSDSLPLGEPVSRKQSTLGEPLVPSLAPTQPLRAAPLLTTTPQPVSPLGSLSPQPGPVSAKAVATGKTLSFQMTLGGLGARPIEIKGSFSINPAPSADPAKGGRPPAR